MLLGRMRFKFNLITLNCVKYPIIWRYKLPDLKIILNSPPLKLNGVFLKLLKSIWNNKLWISLTLISSPCLASGVCSLCLKRVMIFCLFVVGIRLCLSLIGSKSVWSSLIPLVIPHFCVCVETTRRWVFILSEFISQVLSNINFLSFWCLHCLQIAIWWWGCYHCK